MRSKGGLILGQLPLHLSETPDLGLKRPPVILRNTKEAQNVNKVWPLVGRNVLDGTPYSGLGADAGRRKKPPSSSFLCVYCHLSCNAPSEYSAHPSCTLKKTESFALQLHYHTLCLYKRQLYHSNHSAALQNQDIVICRGEVWFQFLPFNSCFPTTVQCIIPVILEIPFKR